MSTLKLSTLSNLAGSQSTAVENAINGSAKAWVNFNGTGTVAIRRAYNVTSITDLGVGQYTVNFTNALSDNTYAVCACTTHVGVGGESIAIIDSAKSASAVTIIASRYQLAFDSMYNDVAIFR